VGEYWVITDAQNVVVYVLQPRTEALCAEGSPLPDDKFVKTKVETEDTVLEVPVSVFPGLSIKLDKNKIEL